jgi:hypothetical protein
MRTRRRIRIQQREVKMAILAQIMPNRYQRARMTRKTAQKRKEVTQVVTMQKLMDLAKEVVTEVHQRIQRLTIQVQLAGEATALLKKQMQTTAQRVRKLEVERVLLRNRILDLEKAVAQLITGQGK